MTNPFILPAEIDEGGEGKKITDEQQDKSQQVATSDLFWKIKFHKEYRHTIIGLPIEGHGQPPTSAPLKLNKIYPKRK
jgi:hypothetical protein